MQTIQHSALHDLLENLVQNFLQDKLQMLMKDEIKNYLEVEHPEERNSRNGYYSRTLQTRYGTIGDLQVPRDRNGEFQTALFEPYQRREGWLEEAVIHMYKGGMSTREVATFIEKMFGAQYSPTTVSNITNTVLADIEEWQKRPLSKRYSVVYLDGMYVKLKRQTVDSEVVYIAIGINEQGYREILSFYIGGKESANGWRDVLRDLYRRGAHEVLLGVFDGLPGLEEAFRETYPRADVQRCIVHKVRNTLPKIRNQDKVDFLTSLKTVYHAPDEDVARAEFDVMKQKWGKKYAKELASWESELSVLLTFYKYPPMIWKYIYTSNLIERTNKEIRKRLRPMNSLPNMEAAEKIIYLECIDYNERWKNRVVTGFGNEHTRNKLSELFEERYEEGDTEEPKE